MEKEEGFEIIEAGHKYRTSLLDSGIETTELIFVKRVGDKFPGNEGEPYPGLTLQKVMRILIDRIYYLDNQKPCLENKIINFLQKVCVWLLEFRAAKHNNIFYFKSLDFSVKSKLCKICGHTVCNH